MALDIKFTAESARELLGQQSVRTTFRISERAIEALAVLAAQLGIKQKSLFDHLMDDAEILARIAGGAEGYDLPEQRVAKTYVVSRKTLHNLEAVAQGYGVARDMLVEVSIERIFPLLEQERQRHEQRKEILERLERVVEEGQSVCFLAREVLAADDPVSLRLEQMLRAIATAYADVSGCVARGRRMEEG